MEKMTKESRALIVNQALDTAGVQNWGRAGIVKRAMNCSPATASGWLNGALPKDPHSLLNFANTYGLDVNLWVCGKAKESAVGRVTENKAETLAVRLREFELDNNKTLTPEQFGKLFVLLLQSEEKASFLLEHGDILLSQK